MTRRGRPRIMTPADALAIYRTNDLHKNVAADFGVSISTVSMIKRGDRYGDVTAAFRAVEQMNAALISAAFSQPEMKEAA